MDKWQLAKCEKAPEGRRTPRRWRDCQCLLELAVDFRQRNYRLTNGDINYTLAREGLKAFYWFRAWKETIRR